jgi:non-heme chloroperoxidase
MNSYADDLAALVTKLDLRDALHVGHSAGGGETVPPLTLNTQANHGGRSIDVFGAIQARAATEKIP